jgi:hypothetical protein
VKDVGKHVEVAAFDMNLSAESGRVADVVVKFNKTYFTGLWMTRSQSRSRATAASRPEVTDEAASPNGEDKAATKAATSRRSATRKTASTATRTRRPSTSGSGSRPRKPAASKAAVPVETRAPVETGAKREAVASDSRKTGMRRTPTRRRVGGTSASGGSTNGTRNGRSTPKPPALRSATESKPDSPGSGDAESVGSPARRRSWRGRIGLGKNDA